MIRAVIFDLDDTLYNEKEFVYSGFMSVAKFLSNKYKIDKIILYNDMVWCLNIQGRGKIFDYVCQKYCLKEDIDKLVKIYRYNKPDITLYDDAYKILEIYKEKYKLGLITDGNKDVQWNKIKVLGIEKYMDKIIVTDDYGEDYWKPSVKPFKMMLEYFHVYPEQTIYVGDNPNKDFIPCKKLGINSVRIIRNVGDYANTFLDKEYEADYDIRSLLELDDILKKYNR